VALISAAAELCFASNANGGEGAEAKRAVASLEESEYMNTWQPMRGSQRVGASLGLFAEKLELLLNFA
jgi:hypothetical protein